MILGIDGNEANVVEKVGVSWCVWHQLRELQTIVGRVQADGQRLQVRVFLKDLPNEEMPRPNEHYQYVVVPKKTLWSQIDLPLALLLKHRDLDYFLSPAHYAPRFCPCPTVVIIHDLSYFYYPHSFLKKDLYQLQYWTEYSVKQAKYVVAVSETTKQDLIKNYQLPLEKIKVIYNGYLEKTSSEDRPDQDRKPFPYFLYLGTLQRRKNLLNLILAFAKFRQTHPQYRLIIVGKKGWLYEELFTLIKNYRLETEIIITGYLSEVEKQKLLKQAAALVVPGFYEGFGLPMLEAFAVKTPVLAANTGALPEIGGQACLYFDPLQDTDLARAMEKITADCKLRINLIEEGKKRVARFSWSKNVESLCQLFK